MSPQPPKKPNQPAKGSGWKQVNPPQPAPKPQPPKPQPPPKKAAPKQPPAPLQLAKPKGSKEIHFACPACNRPIGMPARALGRKARCSCGCRMIVPTPGGMARALWMPSPEQIKASQQQWQSQPQGEGGEDGQNAAEIALETSPMKLVMYAGVLIAGGIGFFIWNSKQGEKGPLVDPRGSWNPEHTEGPKDLGVQDIAGFATYSVVSVEALDAKGMLIGKGPGLLVAKGVIATSLTNVLGATNVKFRSSDGAFLQTATVTNMDDALDLALIDIGGFERDPLSLDDATSTEPGKEAWLGWPTSSPVKVTFGKSSSGALRISRAAPPGSPVMGPKGKLIGMVVASATGEFEVIPAKDIFALAGKKKGLVLAEALSVGSGGTHRADATTIGRLMAAGRTAIVLRLLEAEVARGGGSDAIVALGEALLAERRPRAAAKRFAAAKDSSAAMRGQGMALLDCGDPAGAVAAFRASMKGGKDDALALAGLALALARAGDPAKAAAAAEAALGRNPVRQACLYAAVAGATLRKDDIEKKGLAALEKEKHTDADLLLARGECLLARGDAAGAEKAFSSARDSGGGPRASVARGRALEALGQKDAARDAYVSALEKSPLDEEAVLRAARLLDPRKAAEVLAPLLDSDPTSADLNTAAGLVDLAAEPAKALPRFEQAAKSDPDSAEIARWLAQAQVASGDKPAAEGTLRAFIAKHADDDARIDLALLEAVSNPQQALATADGIRAQAGPVAARAAHARGTALLALGKADDARDAWDIAVSFEPTNGLYRFQRCVAAESGDLHESRALWEGFVAWAKKNGDDTARIQAAERRLMERFGR